MAAYESDRAVLKRENLETKSVATRVIQANRNTTFKASLIVLVAIFGSVITTTTVVLTRPTHVQKNAEGGASLVDSNDNPVSTSNSKTIVPLERISQMGEDYNYNNVDDVKLKINNPDTGASEVVGFRTLGFHWYNSTDMDFFLESGLTLHISAGIKVLVPTVRNAFGITPADHRRKMLLLVGVVVLGWATVAYCTYLTVKDGAL